MAIKEQYTPYPHQKRAIESVLQNEGRALLAITTGGGKTFTTIASLEALHDQGSANNILLLTPASLKQNFINQLKKFSKEININVQESGDKQTALSTVSPKALTYTVVSLELFRNDPQKYMVNERGPIDSVVVDEIGKAKNIDSKTAQSLMSVSPQVNNFIGLTATPSSNSPAELIPLMQAVTGKQFAVADPEQFEKMFLEKVVVKGPRGEPIVERRLKNLKALKDLFDENVFYYGKEDLEAEYPDVVSSTERVPMSDEQMKLYKYFMGGLDPVTRMKIRKGLPVSDKEAKGILSRITKVRSISTATSGAREDEKIEKTLENSPKLRKIVEDIEDHLTTTPDGQIVVYSNLVEGGARAIKKALEFKGIPHGIFAGKGRFDVDRDKAVKDYKEGKNKVLVLSSAGSHGLNLPNTTMVSVVEPFYNPTVTSQAKARGIRIGGQSHRPEDERKVKVKEYLSTLPPGILQKLKLKDTDKSVEEWIHNIAQRKSKTNKEFKQVLRQIREGEDLKIKPVKAAPEIDINKEKSFWGPKYSLKTKLLDKLKGKKKRKQRSDKGVPRGKYRERIEGWKAETKDQRKSEER